MIGIGSKQYFIFPWAKGGNLWDLWKELDSHEDRSNIARRHIPDIIGQLVGLTGALKTLHDFSNGNSGSYRHGDLKPENILVFDTHTQIRLGTWKLADLGLARYHLEATGNRINATSNTGAGTISYQPPESALNKARPTSRLYDIWSMGCIILQLITWLVYGTAKIKEITRQTKSPSTSESTYWKASWDDKRPGGFYDIKIHHLITQHMEQLKCDLRGSPALLTLLSIVKDKLLVVKRPLSATKSMPGCRTNAKDLHQSLREIQTAGKPDQAYWISESIVKQASTLHVPHGRGHGSAMGNMNNVSLKS